MSYKVIVLDIDGTLVNSKKEITKKTFDVLTKMQDEGKIIVIASGRPPQGVLPYAKKLGFDKRDGYILSFNGGRITRVNNGEIVYNKCFPNECLPEICEIIKDYRVTINTYENDTIVSSGNINKYSGVEADIIGLETNFVDDFASYVDFKVNKCLLSRASLMCTARRSSSLNLFRSALIKPVQLTFCLKASAVKERNVWLAATATTI